MKLGNLTTLQTRIISLLRGISPPWTLTGVAALVGVHVRHRTTRDLDLFWHGQKVLGRWTGEVEERLREAGLHVEAMQRSPAFLRLQVRGSEESTVVDLVAEPVPTIESPARVQEEGHDFWVDTPFEILVNKLCALLSRSEPRDLIDIRALLDLGLDLELAMSRAPEKDGGFSPLTLAWILETLPLELLADRAGLDRDLTRSLEEFRQELVEGITKAARLGE